MQKPEGKINPNKLFLLSEFPLHSYDKIRFSDTDCQGHVNNATFNTFLETGRAEFLYASETPMYSDGNNFVIASLNLTLKAEIHWPGRVDIGTGVIRVGKSSISLHQALFQDDKCVATADTVIVQVDVNTKRSAALSDNSLTRLQKLMLQVDEL